MKMNNSFNFKLECNGSSGDIDLEVSFAKLMLEAFEIFKKKQASYGSGNISDFGVRGVFIRMNDKMKRLKRLIWDNRENPLDDETVKDTYQDMANYAFISQMCLNSDWPDVK